MTPSEANRIASLLRQEDERIAREGHRKRIEADREWLRHSTLRVTQSPFHEWSVWESAYRAGEPSADLAIREAAYLAAKEQTRG